MKDKMRNIQMRSTRDKATTKNKLMEEIRWEFKKKAEDIEKIYQDELKSNIGMTS